MTYRYVVFVVACLLYASVIPAQERTKIPEDDLPPVTELLHQASDQIGSLEQDLQQAYLYRQLAALYARSRDLEAAYRMLEAIQIPESAYPQTAVNLKRVGFLEMVEDVALHRDTETAIKVVNECPDEYRVYSDDALGRIALSASQRRDAKGAWLAIAGIKQAKGLYPYELVVATTLDDKTRGKRLLLERHNDVIAGIKGRKLLAREEWAGILWMLSLYKWCDLNRESEELLNRACETTNNPNETRAEVLERLERAATTEAEGHTDATVKKQISRDDIRLMAASAYELRDPHQKSKRLLAVAKLVLEFGRSPIVPNCD